LYSYVSVFSNKNGHTFTSTEARGRIFVAGRQPLSKVQLRAIANILQVPGTEEVRFIRAVDGTPLFAISGGPYR
jgi:hypothetical protein